MTGPGGPMDEILKELDADLRVDEPVALATVIELGGRDGDTNGVPNGASKGCTGTCPEP